MSRTVQQLNYNSFVGGVVTEASPLTFPDGASIDENNFELTKQGTRNRRLGLGAISDEESLSDRITSPKDLVTYLWDSNGTTGQFFLVVATLYDLLIYDVTDSAPGETLVYRTKIKGGSNLSITSHTGQLIIANGEPEITVIRALGNNIFSERSERLQIRDRVGIPSYTRALDTDAPVGLLNAGRASYRPSDSELYLSTAYPIDESGNPPPEPIEIVPPEIVGYQFTSRQTIVDGQPQDDGTLLYRYQMDVAQSNPSFMGYPIETFLIERTTAPSYKIRVVFREQFFKTRLLASGITSSFLGQVDRGVGYETYLNGAEFNDFFNLGRTFYLREENSLNHPHIYNLWNQGWGEKRMDDANTTNLLWPIEEFHKQSLLLPAMSDDVKSALYANNQHDTNRTASRFHPEDLEANPQGSSVAAQGRYVIDALNRGSSRNAAFYKDMREKGYDRLDGYQMSFERTTGGATTVAAYGGRIWYAGFTGDSSGSTIQMSNKILYSQSSDDNLFSCYQEADPTSETDSLLVDTDGGWVSVDEIDEIIKLVPTDTSLLVFATNGVWAIAGSDGNMFQPTDSLVVKLTDKGTVNQQSIVQVDSDLFFWSEDGLYQLVSEGFATFKLNPLTKGTINNLILELTEDDFLGMSGAYDERLDRIIWVIDGGEAVRERRELIYHLSFQAFTINTLYRGIEGSAYLEVLGVVRTPQFLSQPQSDNVVAGFDNVVAGSDNVVVGVSRRDGKLSRIAYIAIRDDGSTTQLFFADKVRDDFQDWGVVDAPAFLLTGYVTGGDASRMKQASSITTHFNRTETNASLVGVDNESSCFLQSQWEWTNDAYANKFGPRQQVYRLQRPQIRGIGQPVAEGVQVVTTKSKLRGRGRTLSLLFSTEPLKDCQILGWSIIASVSNNV